MTISARAISWPVHELGEAMDALVRVGKLTPNSVVLESTPVDLSSFGPESVNAWVEAAAAWLGLQAEPVEASYSEIDEFIANAGPAIVLIPDGESARVIAIVDRGLSSIRVIAPDLSVVKLKLGQIRTALCEKLEAPHRVRVKSILDAAGVTGKRRVRVEKGLLLQLLSEKRIPGGWLIRPNPICRLNSKPDRSRLALRAFALFGAHGLQYLVWIGSWWLLGWITLSGRTDGGALFIWALLLFMTVPLRLIATGAGGQLALDIGSLLRAQLLGGTLRLRRDEIRHLGAGHLLARTLEAEELETFAANGAVLGLTACLELVVVAWVLTAGVGGEVHSLLLVGWIVTMAGAAALHHRQRLSWTDTRLSVTHDLVEQMVGHQTRAAQQRPDHWSDREDAALHQYLALSRSLDWSSLVLQVLMPRGWLVLGLAALVPAFATGSGSVAAFAIALGGVLLAYRAFRWVGLGLEQFSGAIVAAGHLREFGHKARQDERIAPPNFVLHSRRIDTDQPSLLIDGQGLRFQYPGQSEPTFSDLTFQVYNHERILLEGPSGGGKSTLASVLAGMRKCESGLLMFDGLDQATLGDQAWRQKIVLVPQFHDNHILVGTFAFNVLLGRQWPPTPRILEEAEFACRELGLGPLLDRMPSGMQQMVGEMGWQLSHGERSRIYLARAVVQNPDLIILDESFAALDPETLRVVTTFLMQQASALIVIAHP